VTVTGGGDLTADLVAICFDALDPVGLARFWAGVLGWETTEDERHGIALLPNDDTGFEIRFRPTVDRKAGQNQMHVDLTSASSEDQQRTVARSLRLGARYVDVGQRPEEGHVVLGDPEGNEFCVIEPGNAFLAGCGFLGAVACDGSREVGLFWSSVLGWPLVWDQDQETAIRSPRGGPKITWGGPPLMPRTATSNRLHLELAPPFGADHEAEVERLVSLGASRVDTGQGGVRLLADPDGNRFSLRDRREPTT
jgi:predicted enzyme related to lactoylglutathione lyase